MKEILNQIPQRTTKTRKSGLTMVMDKGLSLRQAEDFLMSNHEHCDIIKLGFGTSIITPNIAEKIKLYQQNGMHVYAGGTLFEAFLIRNQVDEYKNYISDLGLKMVEISDGSISMSHESKCNIIRDFSKDFQVISEVGSKDTSVEICSNNWIRLMQDELSAGSWKVIAEAREGGNIGVFNEDGGVKSELINNITKQIPNENIIWEAPKRLQQLWFINNFGTNVNLGNISTNDVIPLECLRLGLRSDTFDNFLS